MSGAAGCAARPPHPEAFSFAVMGDAPYDARQEMEFDAMIGRISAEPLGFVVHVGDIMAGGGTNCADALYADRKRRFDASRHPFVLTPGDNDCTDCRRDSNGRRDPLERLAKVRAAGARRAANGRSSRCRSRCVSSTAKRRHSMAMTWRARSCWPS